jgi:hypothetical protein
MGRTKKLAEQDAARRALERMANLDRLPTAGANVADAPAFQSGSEEEEQPPQ